jgi:hypothetical protein
LGNEGSAHEVTVLLGDEYDDGLREAIEKVVHVSNGITIDKNWMVGGSQES